MKGPEDYLSEAIVIHHRNESEAPPAQRAFHLTNIQDLCAERRSREVVRGLLPKVGLAVVYGQPKCGKSFWVLDLLAHIADNRTYRGRHVSGGPVVYVGLEGDGGLGARAEALVDHLNLEKGVPFYTTKGPLNLAEGKDLLVERIKEQMGGQFPVCLAIDTLNRSISGSENDDRDMGEFIRGCDYIARAFGCVVIVVHHTGKDANGPRGHSSLTGAADVQIRLHKGDKDPDIIIAKIERMKDGQEGGQIISRLQPVEVDKDENGEAINTCVVVPWDGSRRIGRSALSTSARSILAALEALLAEGHTIVAKEGIPERAVRRADLLERAKPFLSVDGEKPDTVRTRLIRQLRKLQSAGYVGLSGDTVWPTGQSGQY